MRQQIADTCALEDAQTLTQFAAAIMYYESIARVPQNAVRCVWLNLVAGAHANAQRVRDVERRGVHWQPSTPAQRAREKHGDACMLHTCVTLALYRVHELCALFTEPLGPAAAAAAAPITGAAAEATRQSALRNAIAHAAQAYARLRSRIQWRAHRDLTDRDAWARVSVEVTLQMLRATDRNLRTATAAATAARSADLPPDAPMCAAPSA